MLCNSIGNGNNLSYDMGPPGRLIGSIYIGLPTVVGKTWILLDMAVFRKKTIFVIIWQLGRFGMVRNTPTGCGNTLPILLRSNFFAKIEKCELFFFGPIFDFFRNLGTREV